MVRETQPIISRFFNDITRDHRTVSVIVNRLKNLKANILTHTWLNNYLRVYSWADPGFPVWGRRGPVSGPWTSDTDAFQ